MDLKQFAEAVKEEASKKLGRDYEVDVAEQLKNNGVVMTQLSIRKKDCQICPSIYLENFFEEYQMGQDLQTVTDNLLSYYGSISDIPNDIQEITQDLSYENMRNRLVFKLIKTYDNQELLKAVPSIPYLDLSIVFYTYLFSDDNIRATAIVSNRNMEDWGVTVDELYQRALVNMQEDFPPILYELLPVLLGESPKNLLVGESAFKPKENGMAELLVLSNKYDLFGAAVLLYPGVLEQCRELLGKDFVILPSSVEEVILVYYPDCEGKLLDSFELSHLIQSINESEVGEEKWLSNHAYKYCSATKQVICA